ncbi:hypothetical protein GW17_00053570 [Ensete ventricosum]|nr:hypothetical protein GW17_00053570 [Ensete ventricosum]
MSNMSPYLTVEEFVLVGRRKRNLFASRAIKDMTELWLVEAGLSPTSQGFLELNKSWHGKEGSNSCASKSKEWVGTTDEAQTARPHLKSMKELCYAPIGEKDESHHAIRMTNLPPTISTRR